MSELKGKVAFITGSTRGIGRAIALKLAKEGAKIVVSGKTTESHKSLPGTIYTVAKEIEDLGTDVLAVKLDVRFEDNIKSVVDEIHNRFGSLDILVNNASAINLQSIEGTNTKSLDLMTQVNGRATFLCTKYCIPLLKKSSNAHVLNLSPPVNLNPKWLAGNVAYTISKYNMSLCTLGMSEELKQFSIAVNSLWPKTTIATSAIKVHFPEEIYRKSRAPSIVADAAAIILQSKASKVTGNFYIDEEVLKNTGIDDFSAYAIDPTQSLQKDFFIDE